MRKAESGFLAKVKCQSCGAVSFISSVHSSKFKYNNLEYDLTYETCPRCFEPVCLQVDDKHSKMILKREVSLLHKAFAGSPSEKLKMERDKAKSDLESARKKLENKLDGLEVKLDDGLTLVLDFSGDQS